MEEYLALAHSNDDGAMGPLTYLTFAWVRETPTPGYVFDSSEFVIAPERLTLRVAPSPRANSYFGTKLLTGEGWGREI